MSFASAVEGGASLGARGGGLIGALFGPEAIPPGALIGGAVGGVGGGLGYLWMSSHMSNAQKAAKSGAQSKATADACSTCDEDKCKHLKRGSGPGKYRGGSHSQMTKPAGDKLESHHMPSDAASTLARGDGPAIQMERTDHLDTQSQSRSGNMANWIANQTKAINGGRFMDAFEMDANDIRGKFPGKYDQAIAEARAYALCLVTTKKV